METTLPKLEARVRPFQDGSGRATRLLAFAELTIAGAFVIKGIRVLKREEEGADDAPFVAFPAEKGKGAAQERWFDVAHPVTAEARAAASAIVLEAYRRVGEGATANA